MTKILLFRMKLSIGRGCLFDGLLCIIFIFIIDYLNTLLRQSVNGVVYSFVYLFIYLFVYLFIYLFIYHVIAIVIS